MLIAFFAIIYKPLNLQRPFQKSEVRDSECLVFRILVLDFKVIEKRLIVVLGS